LSVGGAGKQFACSDQELTLDELCEAEDLANAEVERLEELRQSVTREQLEQAQALKRQNLPYDEISARTNIPREILGDLLGTSRHAFLTKKFGNKKTDFANTASEAIKRTVSQGKDWRSAFVGAMMSDRSKKEAPWRPRRILSSLGPGVWVAFRLAYMSGKMTPEVSWNGNTLLKWRQRG
jgi:hypothetical protein